MLVHRRYEAPVRAGLVRSPITAMRVALADLALERMWVLYPGVREYPLHERVTALPLRDLPRLLVELDAAHAPAG